MCRGGGGLGAIRGHQGVGGGPPPGALGGADCLGDSVRGDWEEGGGGKECGVRGPRHNKKKKT